MFGRKNDDVEEKEVDKEQEQPESPEEEASASPARKSPVREPAPTPPAVAMRAARPEPVRHPLDIRGAAGQGRDRPADDQDDGDKNLTVGPGIELNGQVKSCDKLTIEGLVESDVCHCVEMEIAKSGAFKGEAQVETADIGGRFDGSLTAQKLLIVRATGRVSGRVRFGQIEIERGGEIDGDVQVHFAAEAREPLPIRTARTPAE